MSTAQPPSTADLILVGAAIRTLDKERPSATGLAVAGGQIIAVGDDTLGTELRGPGTEVIDLHGAAVVPGLVDSHMHPVMGLSTIEGVDLSTCADLAAVRDRLAAAAADLAPGGWLTG